MQTDPRLAYIQILKYVHAIIEFTRVTTFVNTILTPLVFLGIEHNDNSVMTYSALDLFYYSPSSSCSSATSTINTLHLFNIRDTIRIKSIIIPTEEVQLCCNIPV